jgi:hypothetical protein
MLATAASTDAKTSDASADILRWWPKSRCVGTAYQFSAKAAGTADRCGTEPVILLPFDFSSAK